MPLWLSDLAKLGVLAEIRWTADQRREIRAGIRTRLQIHLPADLDALDDLAAPPRLYDYSVSISHSHEVGGFVAIKRPKQVGWDVELKARVRPEVVRRISTEEEFNKAPVPELLWCAKEAFYKALEDEQPQVITELSIADWTRAEDGLWTYRGYGPRNAQGIARAEGDYLFAAAIVVSE